MISKAQCEQTLWNISSAIEQLRMRHFQKKDMWTRLKYWGNTWLVDEVGRWWSAGKLVTSAASGAAQGLIKEGKKGLDGRSLYPTEGKTRQAIHLQLPSLLSSFSSSSYKHVIKLEFYTHFFTARRQGTQEDKQLQKPWEGEEVSPWFEVETHQVPKVV